MAGPTTFRYIAIQIGLILSAITLWGFLRTHDQQSISSQPATSTRTAPQPHVATDAPANANMPVECPKPVIEGLYSLATLRGWSDDNFKSVLERTDDKISYWARLEHMSNLYILYVEDVTKFEQRSPKFIHLDFIWRARKFDTGAVYVADQKFNGSIDFPTATEGPRRDLELELSLYSSNLGQEGLLFGVRSKEHTEEYAKTLLADVKQEWESMGNSPRRVGKNTIDGMGFHGYS